MSIKIMSWVWDNSPYEGKTLLIHLALADWAGDDGVCWPKQEKIAAKARCSVETVRTTTRRLEDDGYLSIVQESKGPGSSHRYRLHPKSSGAFTDGMPQVSPDIAQVRKRNTPNPSPENRQEPSKNHQEQDEGVVKCPYCNRNYKAAKPHNCSANNMLMR